MLMSAFTIVTFLVHLFDLLVAQTTIELCLPSFQAALQHIEGQDESDKTIQSCTSIRFQFKRVHALQGLILGLLYFDLFSSEQL